ncbi:MAG: heme-binding protein [Lachnospiraceae bacterium]|nr:heme-binding protein [Lachnospiraceae bacterium]
MERRSAQDLSQLNDDKNNQKSSGISKALIEATVREVVRQLAPTLKITLDEAKRLTEAVEQESARRGQASVLAVCNPDGNPILVHVMDGAFLVSFDVAIKKAYTAVAVKMSTMELSKLAQPGATFYGLDKMDNGKVAILGGGVPLTIDGQIIGGFAVSGGTGEADDSLAQYGQEILKDVLGL